jgi:phosphoribosyl-ATP pyrophosphohydrolase/phosphoribosyl-AMP cyclohydrolase/histidinol dehydrogenase
VTSPLLRRRSVEELTAARRSIHGPDATAAVAPIVEDVRRRGEVAVREHAERLGDLGPGDQLVFDGAALEQALAAQDGETRNRLRRVAGRIRTFALAQREALSDVTVSIPGGQAGHRALAVKRAGCYAPGGRYPLPSSVLMTAVTARAAGVEQVWVASPRPNALMLAAAAIAGADAVLAAGGAQAVAALAFGAGQVPPCDVVVGPGNRYVTAAKRLVSGTVGVDLPAGPSEVLVLADRSADPGAVAAELLAQAEHDPDAVPLLMSLDGALVARVEGEILLQLENLPTATVARRALANGGVLLLEDPACAVAACDAIAPEHLTLMVDDPGALASRLSSYGTLILGARGSVVFGDYGAGPNHVLPTAGAARWAGGLSVFSFLRIRTWLRLDDDPAARPLAADAAWLARKEGLAAHARAVERRVPL